MSSSEFQPGSPQQHPVGIDHQILGNPVEDASNRLDAGGQAPFINYNNSRNPDTTEETNSIRAVVLDIDVPTTQPTNRPVRVPGTYPPEWLPDHETDSCMACDTLFTLIKRRHHCRSCGKIFCGECCRQKAKLLYLDSKEARVCTNCYSLIQYTLVTAVNPSSSTENPSTDTDRQMTQASSNSITASNQASEHNRSAHRVQGVLKTSSSANQPPTNNQPDCNTSSSSSNDQQLKQVMFADGIRPGTDLSESFPYPIPSSSSSTDHASSASFSLLTRQNRNSDSPSSSQTIQRSSSKKNRISGKSQDASNKNITVCDELGYLPPIVITKNSIIATSWNDDVHETSNSSSSLASIIANQFRSPNGKKTIQASMESRSCPLNGVIKFEEISGLVGLDNTITFLLLKDFYLRVKLVTKTCCIDQKLIPDTVTKHELHHKAVVAKEDDVETVNEILGSSSVSQDSEQVENECFSIPQYWCFTSEGLSRFGQNEIVLVLDKEKADSCIPRDVFKVYLTLHELALRRQSLESLGNLLFQDGLFGNRDTAGLLFVRPLENHCMKNLVIPTNRTFLIALVLQRWEVPWSKVFPMRLLLRLGHQFNVYPYPIISFRAREPVYYEVGHTIISILGDFRNFRYSITHVDGMKVMLNKTTRKVLVQLHQSCYQQFNKVLDSSNNEHVLAWSCCPFPEADGHLVSVQNEDGQYETVEFYKKTSITHNTEENLESIKEVMGASFIIFSGALKVNQSGQSAKISIVEDGLLIQIQSCTMAALKNAIHYMHHFDIDCGKYKMTKIQSSLRTQTNLLFNLAHPL